MNHLTHTDIRALLEQTAETCITIYMPTHHVSAQETRADALRLKNLLTDAESKLPREASMRVREALDKARELVRDEEFWKHQSEGLALFISDAGIQHFRLPLSFADAVYVNDSFTVSPLLGYLNEHQTFYVLAITKGSVRLLEGNQQSLRDLELKGLPKNLEEATQYIEAEKLLSNRSSAGDAGTFHGEGDDTREPHAYVREYLLKINKVVNDFFKQKSSPLVVCAMPPISGLYRKICDYQHLAGIVEINPDSLDLGELHDRSWALVAGADREPIQRVKDAFGRFSAHEPARAECDPQRIIAAARQGRVEALLVSQPVVGGEALAFHERIPLEPDSNGFRPSPEVEQAVQETYRTSGQVYMVSADEMPEGATLAAVMRY